MFIRIDPDAWRPAEHGLGWEATASLKPGHLVIWERQPYRVIESRPVRHVDWPADYRDTWAKQGMPDPDTWYGRPMVTVVRHEDRPQEKPTHLQSPAGTSWRTLPEHYTVCRLCRELPPCTHVHNEAVMERAAERMAEQMAILPGACHACREPITARQKSFTFPGPNLIRPDLGENSAVFHARERCASGLDSYDQRWAEATGRRRFFYCPGNETHHFDGTRTCTDPECPGPVDHRSAEWHRPYPDMRGVSWSGCWCLAGAGVSGEQAELPLEDS